MQWRVAEVVDVTIDEARTVWLDQVEPSTNGTPEFLERRGGSPPYPLRSILCLPFIHRRPGGPPRPDETARCQHGNLSGKPAGHRLIHGGIISRASIASFHDCPPPVRLDQAGAPQPPGRQRSP